MRPLLGMLVVSSAVLGAGCAPSPLVLTPAPCEAPNGFDAQWQRVSLPAQAGSLRLPSAYRQYDSTALAWIAPGRGAIIFQLRSEPPPEPKSGWACRFRSGTRDVHLSTDVSHGDPAPGFGTVAQWKVAAGEWLVILGTAVDSTAQAEQVAAIYSLAP
jgi:hypothetical protein